MIFRDKKEYKKAIENFRLAIGLSKSDYPSAQFELAMTYSEIREFENSLNTLKRIKNINWEGLDKGLTLYENLDKADQINPMFLQNYGYIYFLRADYKSAIKYFEQSLDINKQQFKCYYELGYSYKQVSSTRSSSTDKKYSEDFEKAEKYLKKAINKNPANFDALISLADIYNDYYYFNKNDEKAITTYKKALQLKPDNAWLYYKLANINKRQKNYLTAKQFILKAISLNDKYASAYDTLGDIFYFEKKS